MSYILDALRRADAERQRGGVPGLHDQPGAPGATGAAAAPVAGRAGRPALLWAGAGGALLLALGAAWWLGRGAADGPGVATGAAAVAHPPAAAPPSLPAPAVAPSPVVATAPMGGPTAGPTSIQATGPTTGQPGGPSAAPMPRPAATVAPAQRIVMPGPPPLPSRPPVVSLLPGGQTAPPQAAATSPAPGTRPAAVAADPANDPVRPWASLPEASRAALPPLAWSGVVHAERADQRLVIVNGQVAREGDVLGAGLQLLQIGPKSVQLRWQGQRIEMPL